MRGLRFLISGSAGLADVRPPSDPMARITQAFRRRLVDEVEGAFRHACMYNDLEAAADLLDLLEKWHSRRLSRYGHDRRRDTSYLTRAREELRRRTILRKSKSPLSQSSANEPGAGPGG
jgi:hypothetical protein